MRKHEKLLMIILLLLLGLVLTTWPCDSDLGTWCGVITRCPTTPGPEQSQK